MTIGDRHASWLKLALVVGSALVADIHLETTLKARVRMPTVPLAEVAPVGEVV
jgi:hypothetical protein